jgi:hypothetical protein
MAEVRVGVRNGKREDGREVQGGKENCLQRKLLVSFERSWQ